MRILIMRDREALQLSNLFAALAPIKVGKGLEHNIPKRDVLLFQKLRDLWCAGRRAIYLRGESEDI